MIRIMSKTAIKFISGFLSNKKPPVVGRLMFPCNRCALFIAHRYRPNHNLVLKNKDRNNDDKDECDQDGIHSVFQVFRPIIGLFVISSRVKDGKFVLLTNCLQPS